MTKTLLNSAGAVLRSAIPLVAPWSRRPRCNPFILNSNLFDRKAQLCTYEEIVRSISGNTGNSYITYSLLKSVGIGVESLMVQQQVRNIWADPLPDPGWVNEHYSHCLVTLQDQFQKVLPAYIDVARLSQIIKFLRAITIPIVAYSIGINGMRSEPVGGLAKEILALLRVLSEQSLSLGIRGRITEEVFSRCGVRNTTVIGCPSYFETGKVRALSMPTLNASSAILGTGLFSTCALNPVHLIMQSEALGMKMEMNGAVEPCDVEEVLVAARAYPGYSECLFRAMHGGRVRAFFDIDEWKRYIKTSKAGFAVGTRLHGSIIAMNCGVPALCTAGDYRAEEMCEYLGIPYSPGLCARDITLEEAVSKIKCDQINKKYDETYSIYQGWLDSNFPPNDVLWGGR